MLGGILGSRAARSPRRAWWEVEATPFEDMPRGEKDRLVSAFAGWLASLRGEAWVHGLLEEGRVELDGEEYSYATPRFYVESREDPLGCLLKRRLDFLSRLQVGIRL